MAVQQFFLSPLVYDLTRFRNLNALQMLQNHFNYYRAIKEIDLEKNAVKMMGPYDS